MFCNKCGKEIPNNSDFCPCCGTNLKNKIQSESNFKKTKDMKIFEKILLINIKFIGILLIVMIIVSNFIMIDSISTIMAIILEIDIVATCCILIYCKAYSIIKKEELPVLLNVFFYMAVSMACLALLSKITRDSVVTIDDIK